MKQIENQFIYTKTNDSMSCESSLSFTQCLQFISLRIRLY
jgi:hypothetical protein